MQHPLQCRCGTVKGLVSRPEIANRAVCYCGSCQAFAYFLGRQGDVLDERGGSDVIQVLPKNLAFTQGIGALSCLRLTDKGVHRWYASCCNTPIGNTMHTCKISFVGLLHSCLDTSGVPLSGSFGEVRTRVNTQGARGTSKPKTEGLARTFWWFTKTIIKARLDGGYRHTPFFFVDEDRPIVVPRVLSAAELAGVMAAVRRC